MTGPEHYREAERLIEDAHTCQSDSGPGCGSEEILAEAQVHATLAQAAATALTANEDPPPRDAEAWYQAAGTKPARVTEESK